MNKLSSYDEQYVEELYEKQKNATIEFYIISFLVKFKGMQLLEAQYIYQYILHGLCKEMDRNQYLAFKIDIYNFAQQYTKVTKTILPRDNQEDVVIIRQQLDTQPFEQQYYDQTKRYNNFKQFNSYSKINQVIALYNGYRIK